MDSVHNPDKFKRMAARTKPSQARGKERVRQILAAALELFREHGLESVTTNDIAERAKIPIGSLYRYYPNKESILHAIIDLYVQDMSKICRDIAKSPMVAYLSWDEIIALLLDSWANYHRINGSFSFLYIIWANPQLFDETAKTRARLMDAFAEVLKARCPGIKKRQVIVSFNLSLAAIRLDQNEEDKKLGGADLMEEAASAVAVYLANACDPLYDYEAAHDILS